MIKELTFYLLMILEATLLVMSIRAYRARPERPMRFVLWGCIVYVAPKLAWFVIGLVATLLRMPYATPHTATFYTDRISNTLFVTFMILALGSFIKERRSGTTPDA